MTTNLKLKYEIGLREQDFDRVAMLANASNKHDGIDWAFSAESIRALWPRMNNFDVAHDFMRVEAEDGSLVAIARTNWKTLLDGKRVYFHKVHMHPAWRRRGIGTKLLVWVENRIAEKDTDMASPTRVIQTAGPDSNLGLVALLKASGYEPVRYEYSMVNTDLVHAPNFEVPAGFEIRAVTRANLREIWLAGVEAFADHWGASVETETSFDRWISDPLVKPENFSVAYHIDTNQVASQVHGYLNDSENALYNRKRGWTEDISTRRPYRRLGLARALICHSIRKFRDLGMTETALTVDTENLTGALKVYEACGYRVVKRDTTWSKTCRS